MYVSYLHATNKWSSRYFTTRVHAKHIQVAPLPLTHELGEELKNKSQQRGIKGTGDSAMLKCLSTFEHTWIITLWQQSLSLHEITHEVGWCYTDVLQTWWQFQLYENAHIRPGGGCYWYLHVMACRNPTTAAIKFYNNLVSAMVTVVLIQTLRNRLHDARINLKTAHGEHLPLMTHHERSWCRLAWDRINWQNVLPPDGMRLCLIPDSNCVHVWQGICNAAQIQCSESAMFWVKIMHRHRTSPSFSLLEGWLLHSIDTSSCHLSSNMWMTDVAVGAKFVQQDDATLHHVHMVNTYL